MRHLTRFVLVFAALGFAAPVQAQENNVAMAYFMTTDLASLEQLEEGMRGHVDWHATQNDPWPGFVYEAMTGGPEYVWVSPGHTWAEFDSMPIDPQADRADFVRRAGSAVASVDVRIWTTWQDVSIAPAPDAMIPLWQVVEWDFTSTYEGYQAVRNAFAKVKSAIEQQGTPFQYTVNQVVSADDGPQLFVAIARQSMSELDGGDPDGFERMLVQTYGHTEAAQIIRTFEKYLSPIANRFWVLRQDLSYLPGM
jgi:hypothetical protein